MSKSTTGRRVRDRTEAADLLGVWESSGERLSDWCGARGINWYSLNAYRRRGVPVATDEPQLVELVVGGVTITNEAPRSRYLVRIDDVEIEVDDNFREDTLLRLLQVVAC